MSIEEYAEILGVKIKCYEGDFYVSLRDYEKLVERLRELEKEIKGDDKV